MLYDKAHSKANSTFNLVTNFGFTSQKIGKIGGFSLKRGENRSRLKKQEKIGRIGTEHPEGCPDRCTIEMTPSPERITPVTGFKS